MPLGLLFFALVLLICLALLYVGAAWLMARALLRPPRMTDGKAVHVLQRLSPADIGLNYEPVEFDVTDEQTGRPLRLTGWWMPNNSPSDRCVVLLHGYADAKVGAIAWAPVWQELGWNVLSLDLRAHGQSDGVECTAGYWEQHDVLQVIDQLRATRPQSTTSLALMGISLGAAVACAVTARYVDEGRGDLKAVVLDSPFHSFRSAVRGHADLVGMPQCVVPLALRFAQRKTGARFMDVAPVRTLTRVSAPVLLIHSQNDPFIRAFEQDMLDLAASLRPDGAARTVSWHAGAEHVLALSTCPQIYTDVLRTFLERCIVHSGPTDTVTPVPMSAGPLDTP